MTKHDFNVAMVLLVLITAGTLGYQALNAESVNMSGNCTVALYFSSYDGCKSSDGIKIPPPAIMDERPFGNISPNGRGMIEIGNTKDGGRMYGSISWNERKSTLAIPSEQDSMLVVESNQ